MSFLSVRKLDARGFAHHLILPVLAIMAVAAIGATYLALTHAATALYVGNCAQKVQLTKAAAASADKTCTQQVQDLIDIYQYSATNHFPISAPSSGEIFSYGGATMVTMNGAYNGATQNAVHVFTNSYDLTNGASGTWQTFCTTVSGKLNTAAFTGHSYYDFSPNHTKAAGQYIGSSGTTMFSLVCGKQVSSGGGSTTSTGSSGGGSTTPCTSYTISTGSNPTPSNSPCVSYLQTIVNGAWTSNPYGYTNVAKAYDSYYKQSSSGPIGGISSKERNYNQLTSVRIMAFQAVMAYNGTPLSVTGTTDATTWDALCALAHTYGSGNSIIQAAKAAAAASDSGCSKVTGKISSDPHQTTPPPLSCSGSGVTMNSAKTACTCTNSAQVYSGGKCTTPNNGGNGGCTSNCGGVSGAPTITSFSVNLAEEDPNFVQNSDTHPDTYLATWTSNAGTCTLQQGSDMVFSNVKDGANGSVTVSLGANKVYTITLMCVNAKGTTYASHSLKTPIPPSS